MGITQTFILIHCVSRLLSLCCSHRIQQTVRASKNRENKIPIYNSQSTSNTGSKVL